MQISLFAQDFALTNPTITPNPGVYPGGTETISFNFSTSSTYTFSSNSLSNNYATITFSFTKLNPTGITPTGTGAALFNFVLTNNGGTGTGLVYTYTGTTKDITMAAIPTSYVITFSNVPITAAATQAQSDVRVAGQFTDPGNAPTGNTINNSAVIATYTTAALPVTISNFIISSKNCDVAVQWNYNSFLNGDYTQIEQSADGILFSPVYKINFNGETSGSYSAKLTQVTNTGYYRLKITDKEGRIQYSEIKTAKTTCGVKEKLEMYPNPLNDGSAIFFSTSEARGKGSLVLMDVYGRKLLNQEVNIIQGTNKINLYQSNLQKGEYYIQLLGNNWKSEVLKITKIN